MAARYLAERWSDRTAGRNTWGRFIVRNNTHKAGLDLEVCAVTHRYLGGSPVDPSFAIGVDVEQDQTLHQVWEDQLREDEAETNVRL